MTTLEVLEKKFQKCCCTLDMNDILFFDKDDNGQINNVIAGIDLHCFGARRYDDHLGLAADLFYINGNRPVKGDIIAELNLQDQDYFALLLRFCVLLSRSYQGVDAIDAFNTFQKKIRGFLEKRGFFTTTNLELKQFKGQSVVMVSLAERGIFKLEFIDKTQYYRDFFNNIYATEVVAEQEYVYLMVNNDTSLIKIGTSKNPVYRERTLHSQEPSINLIAMWCCGKNIERKLHSKFRSLRVRGEWFRLTIPDLAELEAFMDAEVVKNKSVLLD